MEGAGQPQLEIGFEMFDHYFTFGSKSTPEHSMGVNGTKYP